MIVSYVGDSYRIYRACELVILCFIFWSLVLTFVWHEVSVEACSIALATQSLHCHYKMHTLCSLLSSTEQQLAWQLGLSLPIKPVETGLILLRPASTTISVAESKYRYIISKAWRNLLVSDSVQILRRQCCLPRLLGKHE